MISIYTENVTQKNCDEYCDGYLNEDKQKINGMVVWVFKRVTSILRDEILNLPENLARKQLLAELKSKLTKVEIKAILACQAQNLIDKNREYLNYNIEVFFFDKQGKAKTSNILKYIFNYGGFRIFKKTYYNGYILAKKLSIKCCPYCNQNYTTQHETLYYKKNNVSNRTEVKHIFPEFDHFYSKSDFPVISISFYNLIPSCTICNSHYKADRDTAAFNLFNPYTKTINNNFKFKFLPGNVGSLYGAGKTFYLDFEYFDSDDINEKIAKSIDFFGIKDNYEKNHASLINDIIEKKIMFSKSYLNTLQNAYGIPFEESYRILFETYYESEKYHQRPFSKLKRDIFDDIDI